MNGEWLKRGIGREQLEWHIWLSYVDTNFKYISAILLGIGLITAAFGVFLVWLCSKGSAMESSDLDITLDKRRLKVSPLVSICAYTVI